MAEKLLSNVVANDDSSAETQGSCLCGTIKYTITGHPGSRVLCHCASCKKSSGSSFMANEFYESKQVKLHDPTSTLKTYSDSSPDSGGTVERSFCGNCGSNLIITNRKYPEVVIVASGTLDDVGALREWKPQVEFFCKRRKYWLQGVGAGEGKQFEAMT